MKTLILMRHAKAEPIEPGQDDFDRPLAARGRRDAGALGDWLRAAGYLPEAALVSGARRTRETWGGLGLDARCKPQFRDEIYAATPATLLSELAAQDADRVLMVGHNPEFAALAAFLLRRPEDAARVADYPTGATAVIGFDIAEWDGIARAKGRLLDYVMPKALED